MAIMDSKRAVKALGALAHETRLAVFRMLVTAGPAGMSPGVLAERLSLPAPTLSFHLKELTYAGLIDGETKGRHIVYSAKYEHMQALMDFLMENCCAAQGCGCALDEAQATPAGETTHD